MTGNGAALTPLGARAWHVGCGGSFFAPTSVLHGLSHGTAMCELRAAAPVVTARGLRVRISALLDSRVVDVRLLTISSRRDCLRYRRELEAEHCVHVDAGALAAFARTIVGSWG